MSKRLTLEDFIKRSMKAHEEGLYRYDRTKYFSANIPVEIFCFKCEDYFWIIPSKHTYREQGCGKCGLSENYDAK